MEYAELKRMARLEHRSIEEIREREERREADQLPERFAELDAAVKAASAAQWAVVVAEGNGASEEELKELRAADDAARVAHVAIHLEVLGRGY